MAFVTLVTIMTPFLITFYILINTLPLKDNYFLILAYFIKQVYTSVTSVTGNKDGHMYRTALLI